MLIIKDAVNNLLSFIFSGLSRFGCVALLIILNSCLDSYTLDIDGYDNLLVVDGLITDENISHDIILQRSTSDIEEDSPYETGATVYVTDNNGVSYLFTENSSGVYSSDSTDLVVEEGDKYTLHIHTKDGAIYQSDECEVLPKATIDSLYYKKDSDWDESGDYLNDGISFYVDGCSDNAAGYVRLLYDEDWKFKTPYPENYIVLEDETVEPVWPIENHFCWKHDSSNDINIFSLSNQVGSEIKGKDVTFVASAVSDRLSVRYSLNTKLLTISKEEYEYWRKLNEATEDVGDVFAKQPYSVIGNVYNTEDESDPVLGFFQIGSVASKRLYVNYEDIDSLDLPEYDYGCELTKFYVDSVSVNFEVYSSLYEIYVNEVVNGDYYIYGNIWDNEQMPPKIIGFWLAYKTCSDCSLTGELKMPDFWEE